MKITFDLLRNRHLSIVERNIIVEKAHFILRHEKVLECNALTRVYHGNELAGLRIITTNDDEVESE